MCAELRGVRLVSVTVTVACCSALLVYVGPAVVYSGTTARTVVQSAARHWCIFCCSVVPARQTVCITTVSGFVHSDASAVVRVRLFVFVHSQWRTFCYYSLVRVRLFVLRQC